MKKPNKRDTLNLFFSAFLVIAFIVCAHFFTQFTSTLAQPVGSIVTILLYVVFGLLLFYATRVGDGKAIKRFSVVTLIVMVVPSLYIIIASLAPGMPFYDNFSSNITGNVNMIVALAGIALGYGIPYTFLSGFEVPVEEVEEEPTPELNTVLEGGIEADLTDEETEEADEAAEGDTDSADENTEESTDDAKETAETTDGSEE
jgi:hypothetical protein